MTTEQRPSKAWGPRPGEDLRAHRMRVFADYPEMLAVLRVAEPREHEAEIWREWHLASYTGDPEMQEIIRESRFDLEAPPEEDEEDIRISRQQGGSDNPRLFEDFWPWLAQRFPEHADQFPTETVA